METQKLRVEIPNRVYEHCQDLVRAELFSDIPELLRQVILKEVAALTAFLPNGRNALCQGTEIAPLVLEIPVTVKQTQSQRGQPSAPTPQMLTAEIPFYIYEYSKQLIKAEVVSTIERLLGQIIVQGVAQLVPLLEMTGREKRHREAEKYARALEELKAKIEVQGGLGKTAEQILEELRKTRREIWEKEYAPRFRQQ